MRKKNVLTFLIIIIMALLLFAQNRYAKDTEKRIEKLLEKKSLNE